jgi:glutaminyl-peptide cyclotransferase
MPTQPTHATLSTLRFRSASKLFITALLCALSLFFAACKEQPAQNQNAGAQPSAAPTPGVPFDGQRAFEHVRKQVEFGARPAGSAELAKARDYITGELRSNGLNYSTDSFQPQTPVGVRQMVNITAELPGESSEVIIISTHYDTKLFKDFTFVGANDGGSSTGAVLELARVLKARGQKPRYTYWFVFFDGEEAFCKEWDECKNPNGEPDNTYGSRRYVQQLKEKNETKRVRAMILLDMVGNKNLEFGRDMELSSQWLVNLIWDTAHQLGFKNQFVDRSENVGSDDHEPFLRAGIDAVDIIQITNNPHWHEPTDTLDTISAASLKIVGDVVLASLPRIEERLQSRSR